MKSFIATLTQVDRPHVRQGAVRNTAQADAMRQVWLIAHEVRDAQVAEKYLSVMGNRVMSTADIAATFETASTNVIKQLNRLVARGLIVRAGTAPYNGGRPAVLWQATGAADAKHPHKGAWESVKDDVYLYAFDDEQLTTEQLAKRLNIDPFTVLARLRKLETAKLVRCVSTTKRPKRTMLIVWGKV